MEEKEVRRRKRRRGWADLPSELVEIIWERLDYSRLDGLRLRSVCSTWRSSLPQTEIFPVTLNHPSYPRFTSVLEEASIFRIQLPTTSDRHHNKQAAKSTSCLIKVAESSKGKIELLHTLTHVHLKTPGPLSLETTSFVPVAARYVYLSSPKPWHWPQRIALFPATARVSDKDFALLAICHEGRLWHWRGRDDSWTPLDDRNVHYDDLAVRNGQYYAVDRVGTVWWINGNLSMVQYSPPGDGCGSRKNLVESRGELYVVDWYLDWEGLKAVDFRVYKLDEEWGRWEKVKSLGDRSFVLGPDYSYSFNAVELFGGKGNCIYFTDKRCQLGSTSSWDRVGLFLLEGGSVEKLVTLPEYSEMLWPSPPPGLEDGGRGVGARGRKPAPSCYGSRLR